MTSTPIRLAAGRRPKYSNKKTEVDGVKFDSKAEARRWQELLLLVRAGEITNLERQVALVLAPGARLHGCKRARPPVRLIVDFRYTSASGEQVWEDCKGMETPISLLKRHLAKTTHNIDVRIT